MAIHRPFRARASSRAWTMVIREGRDIGQAAEELKTSPERVQMMLLAMAKRRAAALAP